MKTPKATHWGDLNIGESSIQCAVLEDGTRVLTRATFVKAIGRKGKVKGGRAYDKEFEIPVFLTAKNLKPYVSDELLENSRPIIFSIKKQEYIGYKAELLPSTCSVFIDADDAGKSTANQKHIVERCKLLLRGLATVGIIGLIDEATGYQYDRARHALEEVLDKFIAKELRKWAKTFPDEFYAQMFRLKGWQYVPFSVKRPGVVGKYTNDLVYDRIAPGVLEELKRITPRDSAGRTKHRYFQRLTEDVGHPRLREHLTAVIALMKASTKWDQFYRMIQRALPRYGNTIELPLDESGDDN